MNDLNQLRAEARKKRDDLIALARAEYRATLSRIAPMERRAIRKGPRFQQLTKAVDAVIPAGGTFTIDDLMAALQARDPDRFWPRKQVVNHMRALRNRGIIHSLRLSTTGTVAIYSSNLAKPMKPMRLSDVIKRVLGERAMRLSEITVGVMEAGYLTKSTPRVLRGRVACVMRRSGAFRNDGRKWSI